MDKWAGVEGGRLMGCHDGIMRTKKMIRCLALAGSIVGGSPYLDW